jgi:hypothetical protein
MKTVDELVSEWTEEEREKIKDLIDECREREKQITENSRICRENLNRLAELLSSFSWDLNSVKEKSVKMAEDMWTIYLRLYGKDMPSS